MPYLAKYDLFRKNFEEQGYSYTTTCLMQAFVSERKSKQRKRMGVTGSVFSGVGVSAAEEFGPAQSRVALRHRKPKFTLWTLSSV